MSSLTLSVAACALMLGGAILGALLHRILPDHHLDAHTKDVVRLGAALLATISGLVLGLLVSSTSSSFSAQRAEVTLVASNMILLDQLLAQYGPEARPERELLRLSIGPLVEEIWGPDRSPIHPEATLRANAPGARLFLRLHDMSPKTDAQRSIQSHALQIAVDIARARLQLFEQAKSQLPAPFLVIVLFWLTMLFVSFSLFSPLNPTSMGALVIIAISASAALFLILELSEPFSGLMRISPSPLVNALAPLGP
jgi:hypothetical protein